MRPSYLFIAGVAKSGSTALASWLVEQRIADYMVPGSKEPYSFARVDAFCMPPPGPLPLLDASVGYIRNPAALTRLPDHRTRVVVCLRNPLERAWSEYRMNRIAARQDHAATTLWSEFPFPEAAGSKRDSGSGHLAIKDIFQLHYPRRSAHHVSRHFDAECERILKGDFASRIRYEQAFFMSNREYPFLSCLGSSFYLLGIRTLLEKYQPEDVILVSLNMLDDEHKRSHFIDRLVDQQMSSASIPFQFSSAGLDIGEEKPDFDTPEWDSLRELFSYDIQRLMQMLKERQIDQSLLDHNELLRGLNVNY